METDRPVGFRRTEPVVEDLRSDTTALTQDNGSLAGGAAPATEATVARGAIRSDHSATAAMRAACSTATGATGSHTVPGFAGESLGPRQDGAGFAGESLRTRQDGVGVAVGEGVEVGSAVVVACGLGDGDGDGFSVGDGGGGGATPRSFAMSVRMRWISAGVIHSA